MTIKTLDDVYRHFRLDRPNLADRQCMSISVIREWIRQTWHFAVAAERARVKAENERNHQCS